MVANRIANQKNLQDKRIGLRRSQTIHEGKLWAILRGSKLGYKFRRQHSIGSYILDFYCTEKKLAIEIDGSQHADQKEYDDKRKEYLEVLGITTLRFWNNEIDTSMDGIILEIEKYLEK